MAEQTLRDFLRNNCMDSEYPESLDGHLFFRFGDDESTNYCFDEMDSEIGIEEAENLVVLCSDGLQHELPLDAALLHDGYDFVVAGYTFQLAKLKFFEK